jgi:hypothetical protein
MAKYATKGVIVKTGNAATPTTSLANVISAVFTPGKRDMIKVTTHDSTSTDEYIPRPLRDTGEGKIVIAWDPANSTHEDVRAAHAAGTKWYFTKVLPDSGAAQWAVSCYITDFQPGDFDAENGRMEATILFKADTVETYTQ